MKVLQRRLLNNLEIYIFGGRRVAARDFCVVFLSFLVWPCLC